MTSDFHKIPELGKNQELKNSQSKSLFYRVSQSLPLTTKLLLGFKMRQLCKQPVFSLIEMKPNVRNGNHVKR